MAAVHGSNADIVGNGYVLSEFLNSASFSGERETGETTTFKDKSKRYIPGLKDTTMSCEGIYDGVTSAVDEILWAALVANVSGLFSYFPEGKEVQGGPAFSLDTIQSSYEINTEVGDVSQISAEMNSGDKGVFTRGRVLSPFATKSAAGSSSSYDFSTSTSQGASLVVHTTSSTNLEVKVQDSADNATFVDLAGSLTFTTGRGSQRLTIPGTVRRYVRVSWTGTGTFVAVVDR